MRPLACSNRLGNVVAFFAGALTPLAFAPFYQYPLAVICPAILLALWLKATPKLAFGRGLLYGLGLFGVGVSWIYTSIHTYGDTSIPLAMGFTSLFVFFLAMFPALQGYLLKRFFDDQHGFTLYLAFPALWVLFEWLRGWLLTGFPWLDLGYTQTYSPLRGLAPIIGGYGISFMLTLSSALLVGLNLKARWHGLAQILALMTIWLGAWGLTTLTWAHVEGKPLTVTLIQGNIPQSLKWSPAYINQTLNIYQRLTSAHWASDLILWPEAAVPIPEALAQPYLQALAEQASQHHTALLLGIPVQLGTTDQYYNAMLALGNSSGHYYKRHLVPFGEYLIFDKFLHGLINFFNIPMSNFRSGSLQQTNLKVAGTAIAPFICYEIAYASLVQDMLPTATLLVTISNDGWFGKSLALAQHLQIAQLRAQESSRYLLFTTNTGITAIINPDGSIQAQAPPFQQIALTGQVEKRYGTTPWMLFKTWVLLVCLLVMLLVARLVKLK